MGILHAIKSLINTSNTNAAPITYSETGQKRALDVAPYGSALSDGNTSTTALGSSETFTGTGEQNSWPQVGVSIKTDAECTLYFDFSNDGTNWDSVFPVLGFKVAASVHEFHTAVKLGRYFRVRVVNGSSAQSYLRLYTYYGYNFTQSVSPLNQTISTDSDASIVRPTSFEDEVVIGLRDRVRHFTKFAYRDNLQAANGNEIVWATSATFTPLTSASTFTIAYTNTTDGLGQNGALTLFFDYLDSNGLRQQATHTLSNTGSDVTSFSGLGINRVAVSSSGSTQANGSAITVTATTGGTTQAYLPAGQSVTQQAIYHVDHNSYGVGRFLWINCNKLTGSSPKVVIIGWVFNRLIATRFEIFRMTIDTSVENTVSIQEPIGFRLSPSDVLYFTADTDANDTIVKIRFSIREYKIN